MEDVVLMLSNMGKSSGQKSLCFVVLSNSCGFFVFFCLNKREAGERMIVYSSTSGHKGFNPLKKALVCL